MMAKSPMLWVVAMLVMTSLIHTNDAELAPANQSPGSNAKVMRECPPPYTNILGDCFYIHMFIPLLTWQEAQTFCKQAGGILAEPRHYGAVIAQLFNNNMADKIFRGVFNRVWVGGQRVGNTTSFEWSSGRTIDETVTEGSDPVFSDEGGDCILMRMSIDEPFQLRATSCDSKTHYACQLL